MAKPQVSQSFWKRFGGWCNQHKIKAAFSFLLVLIVLVAVEGWVQTQISIHFERERFQKTSQMVRTLGEQISSLQPSAKTFENDCSYTTFGGVFAQYNRGCESGAAVVFANVSPPNAQSLIANAEKLLKENKISFRENKSGASKYDLKVDVFDANKIGCSLSATYYAGTVPTDDRYTANLLQMGEGLVIQIDCSAPARAEYFPVK